MSYLMIAVLACASPFCTGGNSDVAVSPAVTPAEQSEAAPQSGPELREAVHSALRRWARATDSEVDRAAREFLVVYDQLGRDERLARTQREQLRSKLRSRLAHLQGRIARRVARSRQPTKAEHPKTVTPPNGRGGPLAQFGPFGGQRGGAVGGQPGGVFPGPPPGFFGGFGRGFGAPARGFVPNHGQQLVELIQRTIKPESWDVNGGRGSIVFW